MLAPAPETHTVVPVARTRGPSSSLIRNFGPWRSAISGSGRPSSACTVLVSAAREA